jgi:hypothetical protein
MASRESFADTLRSVCRDCLWELLPSGVNVTHPDGRHQVIHFELFESGDREVVRLTSIIGDASKMSREQMKQALRVNMSLAHGALALQDDELCMTETLSLEESDAGEIEASVTFIAEMADTYEKILFGTDRH